MITYFLKSATCLALLLAFYHLVLEREKMHNFNRFYLLGSVLFSFFAPLYIIYIDVAPIIIDNFPTTTNAYFPIENVTSEIIMEKPIDYISVLAILYCIISAILLFRFRRNLFNIINKTRKNESIQFKKAILVLVEDKILPHTFWNYIFINKDEYHNKKIEQELFTHELTHVTQKHTLDILILELLQAIFWINPFYILLKKAIQLNHEFIADENVIYQHKNTFQYQHLLLNKAAWKNEYYLASNLNYSLTKKRLTMMTTQSSPTKILLKKLSVIPLLTGFVFLFAQRVEAQEIITEEKAAPIDTIYEEVNGNEIDLLKDKFYKEYIYQKGKFTFKDKNGKKISKNYNELSVDEKKNLVPPPPLKLAKKVPTKKQFEALKNNKRYAVWINGKVVDNRVLNNYKASDFARFSNSFVYKNVRSERFPQENQAHLETKAYFKAQNQKRENDFLKYVKKKQLIKNFEVIKEKRAKIIEIKEQKKNNKKKPDYIDAPIQKYNYPSSNGSQQSMPINADKIIDIREKLKDVNALEINYSDKKDTNTGFRLVNGTMLYYVTLKNKTKYYNKEGKLFNENGNQISNKKAKASEIMPEMYIRKVYYKDEVFCEFENDKPQTSITNEKSLKKKYNSTSNKGSEQNFKNINIDDVRKLIASINSPISVYKRKNGDYEELRLQKPHFVNSSEKRQKVLLKRFSELGTLYFKLSKEDKRKAKRPIHPHRPYIRLMKNNKVFYKLRKDLTEEDKLLFPPPPLKPNATKEEILRDEKAYKAWQKRTGNTLKETPPAPKKIRINQQKERNKLDLIIDMAKNDAKFYFEKEVINSDKAIALLKKNKNLNVHTEATDFNSYTVWISNNEKLKSNKKLSDFEIKMNKKADKILLTCSYGCDWKELTFSLKEDRLQATINQFGKKRDKNDESSFMFFINYNFGRVELISNKGAAWKQLGFNLQNNGTINQFGVKTK